MTTRLVAGCMTGTSIDSIDAALVRVEGKGLEMRAEFVRGVSRPLGELAPRLRKLADQEAMTAGEIAGLSREFSLAHVPVLKELFGGEKVDLVAVHGQTVFHKPPVSWQMLTPAVIAREVGVPVVFDLRAADLAAGGQGAPITPIADWVFLHERTLAATGMVAVVNLGGFCNITVFKGQPADPSHDPRYTKLAEEAPEFAEVFAGMRDQSPSRIRGLDVCPCNHTLDTIARKMFFSPFDRNGERAMQGEVHRDALEDLDGILIALRGKARSLGTGDETADWVSRWRSQVKGEDLAATACEAIGTAIAREIGAGCGLALLAGGGAKNLALRGAIESCCSCRVQTTGEAGLPGDYREAAAMAVLGALCQDRVPITLPRVTGVKDPAPIAGLWVYP